MGLLKTEHGGTQIVDFHEKPQEEELLKRYYTDDLTLHSMGYEAHDGKHYLGSMGIYLFKRQTLFDLLLKDPREDFGKHLIKTQMEQNDVHAYLYDGYWEDIGTVESYYHANLALTRHCDDRRHGLQCYDESNIIMTKSYRLPGAKITGTQVQSSLICEGSIIDAEEVSHSILGVRSVIKKGVVIRDCILMGNEYYERPPLATGHVAMKPGIGENTFIQKAIIDENVKIGKGVKLLNRAGHTHYDSPAGQPPIHVREGIIIVPRGTHLPDRFEF